MANPTSSRKSKAPVQEEPLPQPAFTARLRCLSAALGTEKLRKDFETVFLEAQGDWTATRDALGKKKAFAKALPQLEFAQQVAELTDDNAGLVQVLHENAETNSLRDVALQYGRAQLAELARTTAAPEAGERSVEVPDTEAYAGKIYTRLFQMEPAAVLQRMVTDPGETPVADAHVGGGIATFLRNSGASFNLKTDSVYAAFDREGAFEGIPDEMKEPVMHEVKKLQRVVALSPVPEAVPVLMRAGIHSAMGVSDMPEQQFVNTFSKQLGKEGEQIARQIHQNAVNARVRNEMALIALKEVHDGGGFDIINKSLNAEVAPAAEGGDVVPVAYSAMRTEAPQNLLKKRINWDTLFGDAGMCECGECTSVYSAAAYLVDLLQYLRNNNLDEKVSTTPAGEHEDPNFYIGKGYKNTPLEKLFHRRPDLGCLELTCRNTNTILPYIDLVNEVMENYIAYHRPKAFNVEEDQTKEELLAQPHHTEYKAYCILQNAVYPFTLPYHQPIDAARIYLDFLGTSRHELMDTFRSPRKEKADAPALSDAEKQELDQLHEARLQRAVDAEYLGLTEEEYVILTGEAFTSKTHWDKQCKKTHTDVEYRQKTGLRPVHEYYGYADEAAMLDAGEGAKKGLTFVKDQFLKRTGIEYKDLVELLKTRCLNPRLPQGKALGMMQDIPFTYRFLQQKLESFNGNRKEQFHQLVKFLANDADFQLRLREGSAPHPCGDEGWDGADALDLKSLEQWFVNYFDEIGEVIVLESGGGCQCPEGQFSWEIGNGFLEKTFFSRFFSEWQESGHVYLKDCRIIFIRNNSDNSGTPQTIGGMNPKTGQIDIRQPNGAVIPQAYLDTIVFKDEFGNEGFVNSGILYKGVRTDESLLPWACDIFKNDNCDLDAIRLLHLDGSPVTATEYGHIHRFIRLWRKLGWTIDEVDKALAGLHQPEPCGEGATDATDCCDSGELFGRSRDSGCDDLDAGDEKTSRKNSRVAPGCAITPELLHQLAAVKKLFEKTGLDLSRLLTFWVDISTAGETSLYKRLFLTHNLIRLDPAFKADDNGNYLTADTPLTGHLPVIMAAFNLSADDVELMVAKANLEDKLTLSNLSCLYRHRLLSKVLGLRIPEFLRAVAVFGDPFKDATTTLAFYKNWEKMEEAGFNYRQLDYIINDHDDPKKPLAPAQKTILQLSKTLCDGLRAIEALHQDILPEDEIVVETVRAKAVLLFDPAVVDKIIGITEGSYPYPAVEAPKNLSQLGKSLDSGQDDPQNPPPQVLLSLRKKVRYNALTGHLQVTGILTDAETATLKTLENHSQWEKILATVAKGPNRLFKEVLAEVFESEKQNAPQRVAELEKAEAELKQGDVFKPVADLEENEDDPNTAPVKRRAFMRVFLPYLRRQLRRRFILDTLSTFAGTDRTVTDVLISQVLTQGDPAVSLYSVFENLKDSAGTSGSGGAGYLIPAAAGAYTFIVYDSEAEPKITGLPFRFVLQEDTLREWWSAPQHLEAGKMYQLSLEGIEAKKLHWKTPTTPISAVPAAQWLPGLASDNTGNAFSALKKAALLVSGFNWSADEIRYLHENREDFGGLDFSKPTFEHWLRMEAYTRLRNALPRTDTNLTDFFRWAKQVADPAELPEEIAKVTLWKAERVKKLLAEANFNLLRPDSFIHEENLLKLHQALTVADKIGMEIDLLFSWAKPSSDFKKTRATADSIQKAIRARYRQEDWEQVAKPLHDKLRENQKNALIAYLLQQDELGVDDADGLFEYFLIDVQMDPCMETSRIKQAISSVQLFIQRCFLGLEEEKNGIGPGLLDRDRWNWMQRYRVWEANRKVFLYPENWIEGNLRDDKSPFFKELESELLQKDINKQNVTDALKAYLYKVDEVANMEVVGLYIENETYDSKPVKKLHVFSRTRNAPYFFYYRYYDLLEGNWYPWEKMQVDIPSYDVEDANGQVTGNGCYLTPVVWNGRLLVFFPQFMKKARPNPEADSNLNTLANDINKAKPIEFWEIKMGWSEYRNGKWTQKQISADSLSVDKVVHTLPDGFTKNHDRDIDKFIFAPQLFIDNILILVEDQVISDTFPTGAFSFTGNQITKTDPIHLPKSIHEEFGGLQFFQRSTTNLSSIKSLQIKENAWRNEGAAFHTKQNQVVLNYPHNLPNDLPFYHPLTKEFLGIINFQLEKFFISGLHFSNVEDAFGIYDSNEDGLIDYHDIYHELKRPYSLYNWELFFHTPVMLADALSKAQQYEEAMKWFHFVFHPLAGGTGAERCWNFLPFRVMKSSRFLDSIFNRLKPNHSDDKISEWRNHPFQPHVVARDRPVAYMKWVVMKYLDNLVAWGDHLYRQDTIESINEATQLYILAAHILGPKPQFIPKQGKVRPQTYLSMLDKWDAFSNAMTELELVAPYSNQVSTPLGSVNGETAYSNIFGFASALYFCIPNNPKLLGYWDTVADRLFKIRHCQNIQGVFRKLDLFEPPIDPGLLVKAAAQGLSISSVLNDLNTPMPNYRFYYLLQKALELCGELKSLGGAMLSAIEKKDNEVIALLRAKHEATMHNLVMEVKKQQKDEAEKTMESLKQNRKGPESRMKYYLQLAGEELSHVPGNEGEFSEIQNTIEKPVVVEESGLRLIKFEKEETDLANLSAILQLASGIPEVLAGILYALPILAGDVKPFGVGAGASFGGTNLGQLTQTVSKGLQITASYLSHQSSSAGKKAGFLRALQDRIQQANAAGYEIKQIDKQITAQQIRIQIADLEIANQQKQIDHAREVEDFLRNKYTNDELYTWMRDSLKTLYHQVYSLAYELAKKAEKVFRFERGLSNSNFIQSGYWDAGRQGLLAGERLYVGLKQLEAAYHEQRGHEYEITKHISLRQINPLALLQLRETGTCEFSLPEVLFDMDYPGHLKRRIKSVALSIPCVAGPYTGLNATLRLLENKFRHSAIAKDKTDYMEAGEERFRSFSIPVTSIAASTAQNESGMFELNFKDERYLPFEGAGAISRWKLELPSFRQFDYHTISDVVMHLRYTADEGGDYLKKAAGAAVQEFLGKNEELGRQEGLFALIDLKHDLPNEWHRAMQMHHGKIEIQNIRDFLPYFAKMKDGKERDVSKITVPDVWLIQSSEQTPTLTVGQDDPVPFDKGPAIGGAQVFVLTGQEFKVGEWSLSIGNKVKAISGAYLLLRFVLL